MQSSLEITTPNHPQDIGRCVCGEVNDGNNIYPKHSTYCIFMLISAPGSPFRRLYGQKPNRDDLRRGSLTLTDAHMCHLLRNRFASAIKYIWRFCWNSFALERPFLFEPFNLEFWQCASSRFLLVCGQFLNGAQSNASNISAYIQKPSQCITTIYDMCGMVL